MIEIHFQLNKLNPDVNKAIALRSDVENIVITEATGTFLFVNQ